MKEMVERVKTSRRVKGQGKIGINGTVGRIMIKEIEER